VAPVVREQTLKSVLTLVPKLSDRTINGELLRYLAKTANDEQPGIRTNTTICLGKIAKYLGSSTRGKVLIAAFTRSLRDPFVHARNAALMALSVTSEFFTTEDCALRIMPAICPSLIDKEKLIRDQATKTLDVYMAKIKKAAAAMPDTALPPEGAAAGAGGPRMSTPQPTESSAASWAGWAISSFTNKLSAAVGEIQSSSSTPANGSASSTPASTTKRPATLSQTTSASTLHRQTLKTPASSSSTPSASKDSFFPDDNNDGDDNAADAWGDMDDFIEDDDNNNDKSTTDQGDAAASLFSGETPKTSSTKLSAATNKPAASPSASATPFDDGSEPDFAGWLAAQAQKKKSAVLGGSGGSKPLPKGLAKSGTSGSASTTSKKTTTVASRPKPAPAKKLDLKPKETDDDDGWGGW
jgi:SCY1-like protein 1